MMRKGFTLIELMIVVAIMGILIAVAIPRLSKILEAGREGATKGNLNAIRSAVTIYYGQGEGVWPTDLTNGFSSFMAIIPPARATPLGDTPHVTLVSSIPSAPGTGWAYLQDGGMVWANSTATDVKGTSFTTY